MIEAPGPAPLVGRLGGAVLAGLLGALARVRQDRALHPLGVCGVGRVAVEPGGVRSGVPLLDDPGPHPCHVRWSRATGLSVGPDIEGLALRFEGPASGDLLLASTFTGAIGRHVLAPRLRRDYGTVTTLLPLRTQLGTLLVRLDPEPAPTGGAGRTPPRAYLMSVAAVGQPWHRRGRLQIDWSPHDCPRRHDPVGHPPAGTGVHPFWAALRDPAYVASQRVPAP